VYTIIKQSLIRIVPKNILFKLEPLIRFALYQFYRGKTYQCSICEKRLRRFVQLGEDKLCPNCGSLSRDRRLWEILSSEFLTEQAEVLDFSPSRSLYRVLKEISLISYSSTDLSGDFLSDYQYDIANIDAPDQKYDLIICYHVLEHIENDYQAISEMYRVLKKEGTCIIQTPFKQGSIYENLSIKSKEARLKHFGQKDHVRIYSINGLKERLIANGFDVAVKEYNEPEENIFGFKQNEVILICTK